MKKGSMEMDKMFSLVLTLAVAALVAYLLYSWISNGSGSFEEVVVLPGVG